MTHFILVFIHASISIISDVCVTRHSFTAVCKIFDVSGAEMILVSLKCTAKIWQVWEASDLHVSLTMPFVMYFDMPSDVPSDVPSDMPSYVPSLMN